MRFIAVGLMAVAAFAGYACSGDDENATGATGDTGSASGGSGGNGSGGGTVMCLDGLESLTIAPDNGRVVLDGQTYDTVGVWTPNFGIFDPVAPFPTSTTISSQ